MTCKRGTRDYVASFEFVRKYIYCLKLEIHKVMDRRLIPWAVWEIIVSIL